MKARPSLSVTFLLFFLLLLAPSACSTGKTKEAFALPEPERIVWMEGGRSGTRHVYEPGSPEFEAIMKEVNACFAAARTDDGTFPTMAHRPGPEATGADQLLLSFTEAADLKLPRTITQLTLYANEPQMADTGLWSLHVPLSGTLLAMLRDGPSS